MNEIASQEAVRINSRASSYLSHISKEYKTRIRYIHPNTPLKDCTLDVASPVTPGPAKTLLQEPSPIAFQRCQNFCLFTHLDPDAPALCEEKSRDEVVIIGIERFLPPFLGDIACHKFIALKDLCSDYC
jgi:hypothetical protein